MQHYSNSWSTNSQYTGHEVVVRCYQNASQGHLHTKIQRTVSREKLTTGDAEAFFCHRSVVGFLILVMISLLSPGPYREEMFTSLSSHLSLNREGRWGTTDDFETSFPYFPFSPLPSGTWRTPRLSIP